MSNGFDLLVKLSSHATYGSQLALSCIVLYWMWFQLFLIKKKRRNNSKTLFLCTFRVVAMFLAFVSTQLRGYKKHQKKFKVCKRWYILQHALMRSLDEIPWSPILASCIFINMYIQTLIVLFISFVKSQVIPENESTIPHYHYVYPSPSLRTFIKTHLVQICKGPFCQHNTNTFLLLQ